MRKSQILERLPDKSYIVCRPAAAPCLGNQKSRFVKVVFSRFQRLHKLTYDNDGRITGVVIDIFETVIDRIPIIRRQYLETIAAVVEGLGNKIKMNRRHLRR